jgi:hypothetical protein
MFSVSSIRLASGSLYTFTAKVGHSVSPYAADYTTSMDAPGTTPTQFSHTFAQSLADTGAGIGFSIVANSSTAMLCFQNVSLLPN